MIISRISLVVPKSAILFSFPHIRIFSGFKSRFIILFKCIWVKPKVILYIIFCICPSGIDNIFFLWDFISSYKLQSQYSNINEISLFFSLITSNYFIILGWFNFLKKYTSLWFMHLKKIFDILISLILISIKSRNLFILLLLLLFMIKDI